MTPEPKRLAEENELDKAEELLRELERRQFDRRRNNRMRQTLQWITIAGACLTLGSCITGVAVRMGWRVLGTPDDVVKLQKDMVEVTSRIATLERNDADDRVYLRFLVVSRCLELSDKEAAMAGINCADVLQRAQLQRNHLLPRLGQ